MWRRFGLCGKSHARCEAPAAITTVCATHDPYCKAALHGTALAAWTSATCSNAAWQRSHLVGFRPGSLMPSSCGTTGVGGGSQRLGTLVLAGLAGLIGGALSMAVGEFISVSSQRDAEAADVQRERDEQAKGDPCPHPAAALPGCFLLHSSLWTASACCASEVLQLE